MSGLASGNGNELTFSAVAAVSPSDGIDVISPSGLINAGGQFSTQPSISSGPSEPSLHGLNERLIVPPIEI